MERNKRKEVAIINFEGVAKDGSLLFNSAVFSDSRAKKLKKIIFKVISYADGVMEIAIDYKESIKRVSELITGMFSEKSNSGNLDFIILNYRNVCLKFGRNTEKKEINCMIMKRISVIDNNDDALVDTQVCNKYKLFRESNFFWFDEVSKSGLWFRNLNTKESITISSIENGIVTVEGTVGDSIVDIVAELRKMFVSYSNFYGVKAVEMKFNRFSMRVNEQNIDRILYLYNIGWNMFDDLYGKKCYD